MLEERIERAWKMVLRHKRLGNKETALLWVNAWMLLMDELLAELEDPGSPDA
jgi:hypothetical protein